MLVSWLVRVVGNMWFVVSLFSLLLWLKWFIFIVYLIGLLVLLSVRELLVWCVIGMVCK